MDEGRASGPRSRPGTIGSPFRVLFAALWIAGQLALVLTANRRVDGAFGFRMFSESSTIKIALYREIPDGTRVHVENGIWGARGDNGTTHRVAWSDRVRSRVWLFDQETPAPYGAAAQLARLQSALDDFAAHLSSSDDAETRRLVAEVIIRRNGREPLARQLVSRERSF